MFQLLQAALFDRMVSDWKSGFFGCPSPWTVQAGPIVGIKETAERHPDVFCEEAEIAGGRETFLLLPAAPCGFGHPKVLGDLLEHQSVIRAPLAELGGEVGALRDVVVIHWFGRHGSGSWVHALIGIEMVDFYSYRHLD